jgi:protein-disulfide isomerase
MTPNRVPAGATPEGDGIVVGAGPVTVDAFIDFLCPFCRQFELSSGERLAAMAVDGQISLAYHPMNFLDAASTTRYSTRAAAASGCAADGGRVAGYVHALFVDQPPEGSAGLSDARLVELGVAVGLPRAAFGECVQQGRYLDWPPHVTARATALGVSATPTVLVAGVPVPANARMIAAAVAKVTGA